MSVALAGADGRLKRVVLNGSPFTRGEDRMPNPTVLRGVVLGKMIEMEDLLGFPDGQVVAVTMHPVTGVSPSPVSGASTCAETGPDIPGTPSNTRLRELAAKHQPAKEWFEASLASGGQRPYEAPKALRGEVQLAVPDCGDRRG